MQANRQLLILGQPGSGKTTLLLELARDLLEEAEQEEILPVPVVLNLASWGIKQQQLAEWAIDELRLKYASWVANDWRDGNDNPIKNWKTKLLNTIKFLKLAESTKTRIAL